MTLQLAEERASARPVPGQVAGRTVMLIPHREPGTDESIWRDELIGLLSAQAPRLDRALRKVTKQGGRWS
jgi:hypothetical protein